MSLTFETLIEVLNVAEGPKRSELQHEAEQQLKAWETQPGYHYLLQEIYIKENIPLSTRWIAIICFKNGIEKYWRSSRVNAISKDEKAQIRSRLFNVIEDKNSRLTVQNAHAIARIIRLDFPSEWPGLFDEVTKTLEDCVFVKGNLVATNNVLIILNQMIKSVALVRIGRARQALQSKAPLILPVLVKLYMKFYQMWRTSMDVTLLEICYLCLKNLRRLIPEGFDHPDRNQDIVEFMKVSIAHLRDLVTQHEKYASDMIEKFIKCYSKLYVNLIDSKQTSFVLMPCSPEIISTFMSLLQTKAEAVYNSSEENDFWEVLAVKGFLIMKKMVAYVFKGGAITLKDRGDKEEVHSAINLLKMQLFTSQVIVELCDLIINWYLRLKPSDLEGWLLEPEEWTNEELSSSWEYQIRPCAENFFQDLIKYFKDDLSDFILNKISSGLCANDSIDKILIKDSKFCIFQLSAHSIADKVNFNQLLEQVFIPEGLRNDVVENKIIKRRICLIISAWIDIDCSPESRVRIYKLFLDFLNPDNSINDKVVKLTTIQCLRNVVNDWKFVKQDFQPFLQGFVNLSIAMLHEMAFTESKLFILDTLATLIERCNPLVDQASLMGILSIVPEYWDKSNQNGEDSILKTSLLRVLRNLVVALNANSFETHFITITLIRSCCTKLSENYLLAEDGYNLWLATLQYYPVNMDFLPELFEFFELLQPSLMELTEILTTILSIVRSYALIVPDAFQTPYSREILQVLSGYLPSMRDDSFEVFVSLMDILFLLQSANKQFVSNLVDSGLMHAMTNYVLDDHHSIVLANKVLLVLSRLAATDPEVFCSILGHLSVDVRQFMEVWVSYYKNNGSPRSKKINLLALISVVGYCVPKNLYDLQALAGEVFRRSFIFVEEVNEDDAGNCNAYYGDYIYYDIDNYAYLDPDIAPHGEKLRYLALEAQNPALSVNVQQLLKMKVSDMRCNMGTDAFSRFASFFDQYTLEKMGQLLN
ncbi:ARM repeat-containing protein [Metschnikowia bicuspidata]|uniref:ARM repeat-containing protein n=1 Tax=Metschnikowia bicuspidata TaxID=27322 RepID=A0A4P9ZHI5_9ASCO|nr:ARM repeat-containing protein [Metschnikowia bicuspidata]